MEVKWKMPGLFTGANAEKCYREIISIGDAVTPEQILEFARNPETELHKCFEWDDSVAAEKYRLQQSRLVVCHLVVLEEPSKPEPQKFRLLQKTDDGYKPTKLIYQNKSEYEKLLEQARGELRAFKQRFTVQFMENVYSAEQIINIINLAGFGLGIGSGRSSGYGRYHVESIG